MRARRAWPPRSGRRPFTGHPGPRAAAPAARGPDRSQRGAPNVRARRVWPPRSGRRQFTGHPGARAAAPAARGPDRSQAGPPNVRARWVWPPRSGQRQFTGHRGARAAAPATRGPGRLRLGPPNMPACVVWPRRSGGTIYIWGISGASLTVCVVSGAWMSWTAGRHCRRSLCLGWCQCRALLSAVVSCIRSLSTIGHHTAGISRAGHLGGVRVVVD